MSASYNGDPNAFSDLWEKGYDFNLSQYVNRGIEIFKANWVNFVVFTLIIALINSLPDIISDNLGTVVQLIIGGPLMAGYFIVARKVARNERTEFSDFFKGFDDFIQLFLGNLVVGILVVVGILLLAVPGIYLAIAYAFWIPLIVFDRLSFWNAMETSRKIITQNWWNFLLMALVAIGFIVLGAIALIVGLLAAVPIIVCMYYAAYEDIVDRYEPFDEKIDEIGIQIDEIKDFDDV